MVTLDSDPSRWGALAATAGAARAADEAREVHAPLARDPDQLPEAWFRDHFSSLWRLVARLGVPGHSVDDIVQEAFIVTSRRRSDIVEGQERRFLIATAIRLSSNYRQRASVRREVSHTQLLEQKPSSAPDAEQLLIQKRMRQELEEALSTLSAPHRAVFVLYELEGFSVPEIAELLGLPIGTVASRLGRARAKFSLAVTRLQRATLPYPEAR
jgi:RNA polymerase sigma-70 factor, ECF subfamily